MCIRRGMLRSFCSTLGNLGGFLFSLCSYYEEEAYKIESIPEHWTLIYPSHNLLLVYAFTLVLNFVRPMLKCP